MGDEDALAESSLSDVRTGRVAEKTDGAPPSPAVESRRPRTTY
jgi:hypothetical protein